MRRARGAARPLLPPIASLALLASLPGCQSTLSSVVTISSKTSILAVDVRFPVPLGRDPDLVEVFLVRGPVHASMTELPELVSATFVKGSRAYLLDPAPGTYSLVAVSSAVAAPLRRSPVAGGITNTTLPGTIANATIFPASLVRQTRTSVGQGSVGFMGVVTVRPGERINASAVFQDALQERLAQRIRPDAAARSGLAGWLTRAWLVDLEGTTVADGETELLDFLEAARADLAPSSWASVIDRAEDEFLAALPEPEPAATARSRTAPKPEPVSPARPGPSTAPTPTPAGSSGAPLPTPAVAPAATAARAAPATGAADRPPPTRAERTPPTRAELPATGPGSADLPDAGGTPAGPATAVAAAERPARFFVAHARKGLLRMTVSRRRVP